MFDSSANLISYMNGQWHDIDMVFVTFHTIDSLTAGCLFSAHSFSELPFSVHERLRYIVCVTVTMRLSFPLTSN